MSVTQAGRNFSDVVGRAYYRHESTLLLKGGQPVARIVPIFPKEQTAGEIAKAWNNIPHLNRAEAISFEQGLTKARKSLPAVSSPWESS